MSSRDVDRLKRLHRLEERRYLGAGRFSHYLFTGGERTENTEEWERRFSGLPFVPRDHRIEIFLRQRSGR